MAYCTVSNVDKILAQGITTGNPSDLATPVKLSQIGRTRRQGLIPEEDVLHYIRLADNQINAALSEQYFIPLSRKCTFETTLASSLDEYSDSITLSTYDYIAVGDTLFLTDNTNEDTVVVTDIDTYGAITTDPIVVDFDASNTRVLKIEYPHPVSLISAKLAAANLYERLLKAQQEPGKSEYSDLLRKQAVQELNNIREGRTILDAKRKGWRFANANLVDRYGLKSAIDQDGTRSEQQ
jgi:hypothetical protein